MKKKYDNWIVADNETGLVIIDSDKQEVRLALDTKGYRTKRKL